MKKIHPRLEVTPIGRRDGMRHRQCQKSPKSAQPRGTGAEIRPCGRDGGGKKSAREANPQKRRRFFCRFRPGDPELILPRLIRGLISRNSPNGEALRLSHHRAFSESISRGSEGMRKKCIQRSTTPPSDRDNPSIDGLFSWKLADDCRRPIQNPLSISFLINYLP